MSSKTMFKSRIHDNDVCLMRLSNGAHLPRLMWFRNAWSIHRRELKGRIL
jgi:hypothetical protein